jgi:hypothetical protein
MLSFAAPARAAIAPSAITDLRVSAVVSTGLGASTMSVTLQWTAPGEEGSAGMLNNSTFSLRYSSVAPILSDADFDSAGFVLDIATSGVLPGSLQTVRIDALSVLASHYFVIKTTDSEYRTSPLSSAATAQSCILTFDAGAMWPFGIAFGDYDGDGRLDALIANGSADDEILLRNQGDGTFAAAPLSGTAGDSRGVAWADYDNDGHLDAVVANASSQDEMLLHNNGDGTFTGAAISGSAGRSQGIAWGDYDNDGRMDVLVANFNQNSVLFHNTGGGSFSTISVSGVNQFSMGAAWGDYDKDGDLDAIIANDLAQDEILLRNDGNGAFSAQTLTGTGGDSRGAAWGDYDGDGWLDAVIANSGQEATLLHNNQDGTFSISSIPGSSGYMTGIAFGDYDNDGDLDIAATYYGMDAAIFTNDGAGNFSVARLSGTALNTTGMSAGDMDGDGDIDLLAANDSGQPLSFFRNDIATVHHAPSAPSAGFSASFQEYSAYSSSGVLTLSWAGGSDVETSTQDLRYYVRVGTTPNGHGLLAVPARYGLDGYSGGGSSLYSTWLSPAARGLRLSVQRETTAYWAVTSEDSEMLRSSESSEQAARLSAPGAVQDLRVSAIVSTGLTASSMAVTLQWTAPGEDGYSGALVNGAFEIRWSTVSTFASTSAYLAAQYSASIPTSAAQGQVQTYSIPFLNAYSTYYFALTTTDHYGVRSLLSNPATAQAYVFSASGSSGDSRGIAWGDYDRDGWPDLAVANTDGDLFLLHNEHNGTFTKVTVSGSGAGNGLAWGDYDHDGWLDLAVAVGGGGEEYLLRNNHDGSFTKTVLTGTGGDSQAVAWGDYDNDGNLDLAVANAGVQDEVLAKNNGDGSFTITSALAGSAGDSKGIAWGDYDNDGDLDLAVPNASTQDEFLLRNDGNGAFTKVSIMGSGGDSQGIAWGDYDSDGWLDLAVSNTSGNAFTLRNNHDETFSKSAIAGSGVGSGIAWCDLNGDGRLDLVMAKSAALDDVVLYNNGDGTFSKTSLPGTGGNAAGVSCADFDRNGTLDLAFAVQSGGDEQIVRNDTGTVRNAPSAPASLSAAFQENGVFTSTGILTLRWTDAYDAEDSTAVLRYYVRVGTGAAGSSTIYAVPPLVSADGYGSGGSFFYSTKISSAARGLKLALQKEATVYWAVETEDGTLLRSLESSEQAANLSAPASAADLNAAQDASIETSSIPWISLSWTVPGENGVVGALQPGALYDLRWSTVSPIITQGAYMQASYQLLIPADGEAPGAIHTQQLSALIGTTYYFALTTLDSLGVRSGLSNPASMTPNIVEEDIADVSPAGFLQGDTTAFLRLRLWTRGGTATWTRLRVKKLGGLPDAAIKNVGVHWDVNGNGVFDGGDLAGLRSLNAVFSSSAAVLTLSPQTLGTSTKTYFVTLELNNAALPVSGSTVGVRLDGEAFDLKGAGLLGIDYPGMRFDGIGGRVHAPFKPALSPSQITVEAWVRTLDAGADRSILTRADATATAGYRLWLNGASCGAGVPTFFIGDQALCANRDGTPVSVSDGQWHHIAAVYDAVVGKRLFVDGRMLSTGPVGGILPEVTGDVGIGGPNSFVGNAFTGAIDEVRITNGLRYGAPFTPVRRGDLSGGTVLLYHFDAPAGTGTVATDEAGNFDGVIELGASGYARSTTSVVMDASDILFSSWTDLSPASFYRNQTNIALLKLQLWADHDSVVLDKLSAAAQGDGAAAGATNLRLYLDNGDGIYEVSADTALTSGQDFSVGKATFDLVGAGAAQTLSPSTKTYFVVWDVSGGAELGKTLGISISTQDFVLAGTTDSVSAQGFPPQTLPAAVLSASPLVISETPASSWVAVSSLVFSADFVNGNADHLHYAFDQAPGTVVTGADAIWSIGKATVVVASDAQDWWFHVRAYDSSDMPGIQRDLGPFYIDRVRPSSSSFVNFTATGTALAEGQFLDLAAGVTAQISVQDILAGMDKDGPAPLAPSSGTVSLWHLDEAAGSVWKDSGPASIQFTALGPVTMAVGRFRGGVLFDGSGHLLCASPAGLPVGSSARAVEAWVNPVSTQGTQGLVTWGSAGAGTLMRLSLVSGRLSMEVGGSSMSGGPVLSTGSWYHAAFSYDGEQGRLFLNGSSAAVQNLGALSTALGSLTVGAGESGNRFKGWIDEVRVLDRALNSGEAHDDALRGNPFYAAYSTNTGSTWQMVVASGPSAGAWVSLGGAHGGTAVADLKLQDMSLVDSTSTDTGGGAGNQVRFYAYDRGGNLMTAGPYGILVDSNAAAAVSFADVPADGAYVGTRPQFSWTGPSSGVVSGLAGPGGSGGWFYLQAAANDPSFAPGNVVVSVATQAYVNDTGAANVVGAYASTFTLVEGNVYYWRVQSKGYLGDYGRWSATSSFTVDRTTPAAGNYRVINSTGGVLLESQYTDLRVGSSVQLAVSDNLSGFSHAAGLSTGAGTVALWSFSERDGQHPRDASGNGNHAVLLGAGASSASYRSAPFGAGLRCEGAQVSTAPGAQFDFPAGSDFTFETWMYPESFSGNPVIGGVGSLNPPSGNWVLRLTGLGQLYYTNNSGGGYLGPQGFIQAGAWQHVAMVVRGSRVAFYVNGIQIASGVSIAGGNSGASGRPFSLCAGVQNTGTFDGFFNGTLDEVQVLNYAAASAKIAADYAASAAGRFSVEYSTDAGNDWRVISATSPAQGWPYAVLSGSEGSLGPETLSVRDLPLAQSTSTQTGSRATNQVRFILPDRKGNLLVSGPYGVIVDTVAGAAVSTPAYPADGSYAAQVPNFLWFGPSTITVSGMGSAASYRLEADNDPNFGSPEVRISTPVILQSEEAEHVFGAYLSTQTLSDATTYYWRVSAQDYLGQRSPTLTSSAFVTDFSAPAASAFRSMNSTGGWVQETMANDGISGVSAAITLQDGVSGLKAASADGSLPYGVLYSSDGGSTWQSGGFGDSYADAGVSSFSALAVFGGRLYAGGGGVSAPGKVYSYDGADWGLSAAFAAGADVKAFCEFQGELYAGLGNGTIQVFDGSSWSEAAALPETRIDALASFGGRLFAAGRGSGRIWMFDPEASSWMIFHRSTDAGFHSLKAYNNRLYAGGSSDIYVFNGSTWTISYAPGEDVLSMEVYAKRLYAGTGVSGRVFVYDGTAWQTALDASEDAARVLGAASGRLHIGASGPGSSRVYTYDNKSWMTLRAMPSVDDQAAALADYDGRLFLSGASPAGGKIWVSTPLAASLTGSDGDRTPQTLSVSGLELAQSGNGNVCAGNPVCSATNQVRFTASDRAGSVVCAGPYAVLVDPLLIAPTALYPASGAFVRFTVPTFTWLEAASAGSYRIQVSTRSDFSSITFERSTTTTRYPSPVALSNGGTYYWRAQSISAMGIYSAVSSAPYFFIDATPPAASLFRYFNSTGGALDQTQYSDLAAGVTAQVSVRDLFAGLDRDGVLRTLSGTAALYPFDDAEGTQAAEYQGKDSLRFSGTAGWASGVSGSAASLDGASYLYSTVPPGLPSGDGARTVELWVYPGDASGGGLVQYGDQQLHINGDCAAGSAGNTNLCVDGGNAAAHVFSPGQWHHVAYVYDGAGNNSLYADGMLLGTYAQTHSTLSGPLFIGTATARGAFNGRIDEFRILSRALSSAEIESDSRRAGAFRAEYSTDTGAHWTEVTSTAPASGPRIAYSAAAGSRAFETLRLEGLDLPESASSSTGAFGSNQIRFYAADQAGNEVSAGPFSILVDTSVPGPWIETLMAMSTTSLYAAASATDALSGILDYRFEASSSPVFAPPVSTSPYLSVSTYAFTDLAYATTYYVRVSVRDNLLNTSALSVTAATSTFGTVFMTTAASAPGGVLQGEAAAMLRFSLSTLPMASSRLRGLRVRHSGTAPDSALSKASLYKDNDSDGLFDPVQDVELAIGYFSAGEALIDLEATGNGQDLDSTPKIFFLVYGIRSDAPPNSTVGVSSMVASDFILDFPFSPEGPFPLSTVPIPVSDGPNTLALSAVNAAPASVQAGQTEVPLLRLLAQTASGTSILDQMTFHLTGTLPGGQIAGLSLWRDADANGVFDKTRDQRLSPGDTFVSGVSTVTLSAAVSSRTVNTAPMYLFVTANIGVGAPQGTWLRVELSSPSDVVLNNAADSTEFSALPLICDTASVVLSNTVRVTPTDQTPAAFMQGDRYSVLRASISVDIGFAQIDRVSVDRSGTAQDADVSAVEIWRDQTPDGAPFNPIADVFLGSGPFVSGRSAVGITTASFTAGTTGALFIAFQMSPSAGPGRTLGAVLTNSSYIRAVNPLSVISGTFPVTTALAPIQATANQLLIPLAQSVAPGGVDQGASDTAMLRLDLVSSRNDFDWLSLRVQSTGTAQDSDVRGIRVYRDDGDGAFSAIADAALSDSSQTFSGGAANITLSVPPSITAATHTYFVTVALQPTAVPGRTIGLQIGSTASFNLSAPNTVSTRTAVFPFTAGPVAINQFSNTVAVSTRGAAASGLADPGALNQPLLELSLRTDVSLATWTALRIDQSGSAADSEIKDVKIYCDINDLGVFNSSNLSQYVLVVSTGQRFGQTLPGSVTLALSSGVVVGPAARRYFAVVDISSTAVPGHTVSLRAVNAGYFSVSAPNQIGAVSFNSPSLTVSAPPALMYVDFKSSAPATVRQGDANVPMSVLKARMSAYSGEWTRLTLDRAGAGLDSDVSSVKLFLDSDSDGRLNVLNDARLSTAAFVGGSAVLSFSAQTLTSSTQTYFLAYDVSMTAAAGDTLGAGLGAPGVFSVNAPNSVSSLGFPAQSALSTVRPTQAALSVSAQDRAPGQLLQGATNQVVLSLSLNTTAYAVLWNGLTVTSAGTAQDSDIRAVRVWKDVDGNGALDAAVDQDLSAGQAGFLGGSAVVSLLSAQTIGMTPSRYLISVDVADHASSGLTFGVVLASTAAFALNSPNTVAAAGFPFSSTAVSIRKQPEELSIASANLLADGVNQGSLCAAARITARASRERLVWRQLRVVRTGSLSDAAAGQLRIYRDVDGSGAIGISDVLVGTGTFSAGSASVIFSSAQSVGTSTQGYIAALALDPAASVGATFGLTFADASFFTVDSPDSVSSSGLPASTALASILDSRTPVLPVVSVDGPYSSQFEYLHFVWSSSVGAGNLSGAFYAVGTAPGAEDVAAYTAIAAGRTDVRAEGFPLRSGATYYISVKTQSDLGFLSPVGTSMGVLVDFTVPPTPAPTLTLGQSSVLVNWGAVSAGPSGVAGYLVEYRRADGPIWYSARTGQASRAAALGNKPVRAAAVSADEIISGISYQITGLAAGTIYVRMRSVSGAGVASAPSSESKLQVGALPKDGVSAASNYPNPFDSRKQQTTITYALSQSADVTLRLYDVFGSLVNEMSFTAGTPGAQAGTNEVRWDGTGRAGGKVSKGMYLCVLQSGGAKVILKIGVIH